jgi:Spy/CpxP family protein refolding chaperone
MIPRIRSSYAELFKMNVKKIVSLPIALMVLVICTPLYASGRDQQQQGPPADDPVRELNLSPEQREKIRALREQMRDERAAINQRLRATNHALEEVLDSENPDEAVIEARLREVAEAQAASMRMRVLTEFRIRRVLTPEQLATLRTLRENARSSRRGPDWNNPGGERREGEDRPRRPRNQGNGLGPFFPKRDNPSTTPRP